ncbi:MAG TPA: outer membrane beta-barrel protein [Vicinamibacteria bacterium]|nr:outer membrane beta-barrel protein [Vicinamibacteria bacterium]
MLLKIVLAVVMVWLASADTTTAQPAIEITPFYGLRANGAFRTGQGTDNVILEVKDSGSYGVFFDYGLTEFLKLDVLWTHQSSTVLQGETPTVGPPAENLSAPASSGEPLFDVGIDYVHAGVLYGGGNESFSAYAAGGAGVGFFNPDVADASSVTKFSFSLGAGFRSKFNRRFGFRFDARVFGTRAGDREQDFACGIFGCTSFESASTFWQTHFVGGLIFSL